MKVSLKWLNELVDIGDISQEELAREISLHSIEIESIVKMSCATNVVVGKILDKQKHPSADKLSVCLVDVKKSVLKIVCGAPNVDKDQLVAVALEGTILPGGLKIEKTIIRGVESNGMICSLKELGLEKKYIPEAFQDGIVVLDEDAEPGMDALEYLGLDDVVFELGLTPNRADLLSMRGVAQDVAAVFDREVKPLQFHLPEMKQQANEELIVENRSTSCLSYHARIIKDITIAPSPNWLKSRLISSGIRPINNVVDVTNYILMLFGQPLHAFDQEKLGKQIIVRNAMDNEEAVTLDGEKRVLVSGDIAITNGPEVVAIGGVMGCQNTEVTEKTKNIVLEAAIFSPMSVRRTSSRLGLRSESSIRFERGVDVNQTKMAVDYAAYLLHHFAKGSVLKDTVFTGIDQIKEKEISLPNHYVEQILGVAINPATIRDIARRLGFSTRDEVGKMIVTVPNRRLDVNIKEDCVEEFGRIFGYDKLPLTLPKVEVYGELTKNQKMTRIVRSTLNGLGLKEVITYSLVPCSEIERFHDMHAELSPIRLLNPISEERSMLRKSLIKSLLDVACYNSARKMENLMIFEIGNRYHSENGTSREERLLSGALTGEYSSQKWQGKTETIDFFTVKGILTRLFEEIGVNPEFVKLNHPSNEFHPNRVAEIRIGSKRIGILGEVHPKFARDLDLKDVYVFEILLDETISSEALPIKYVEIPKIPSVERDLAFVVKKTVSAKTIVETIRNAESDLIQSIEIFDLYQGDRLGTNLYSIAVRLTFQGKETLKDDIIQDTMSKIIRHMETTIDAKLRSF